MTPWLDAAPAMFAPDMGGTLVVRPDGDGSETRSLALIATSCTTFECTCAAVELLVVSTDSLEEKRGTPPGARLRFDPVAWDVELEDNPDDFLDSGERAWFERELCDGELGNFLANRAYRQKFRKLDRPWRARDWSRHEPGAMVPFMDVVPADFEFRVDDHDRVLCVIDHYCVAPGCDCNEVALSFLDGGQEVGDARVDLAAGRVTECTGEGRGIWSLFTTQHGLKPLRARYRTMRKAARDIDRAAKPAPVQPAAPKAGRNGACPCGSGRKFKKCCGSRARA